MNLFFTVPLILFSFFVSSKEDEFLGGYVVKKNCLSILCPQSLGSTYDLAIGNFGNLDHRGSIVGTLVYPQKSSKGCRPFDGDDLLVNHSSSIPTILLLDRGDCYFALKVWNAQQAGAAAVLIADDIYEPLITINFSYKTFGKITIPSALIQRSLGDTLKSALMNKGEGDVVIKLDLSETKDGNTSSDCSNLENLVKGTTI